MTGWELRHALITMGISGKLLSEMVGKHPSAVSRWKTGREAVPKWVPLVLLGLSLSDGAMPAPFEEDHGPASDL